MELKEFVSEWKDVLTKQVIASFTPTYQFEQKAGSNTILQKLKRKLLPSQEHIALAVRRYLSKNKSAFIVGEMGVGKTILSIGISALLKSSEHQNKIPTGLKTIIMCPSHLCKKWEREIIKTHDGSKVFQLTSITELETAVATTYNGGADKNNYFVLSKETAKLSYEWKAVAIEGRDGNLYCPDCGALLINSEDDIPLRFADLDGKKSKCHKCKGALWQATRILKGRGKARYSLAKYIHDRYKRFFDLLVIDEAHQYKASGSAQGQSMSLLVSSAKKVLALTGTIFGGRSTSLFYILYRLTHSIKNKFEFRAEKEWAKRYGIIQKITKAKESDYNNDGHSSSAKDYKTIVRELPGASPDIINFLLDKTAFFKLADLGISLPKFSEEIVECKLEKGHQQEYDQLEKFLLDEIKDAFKKKRGRGDEPRKKGTVNIGLYLQMLLTYPDQPFKDYTAIDDNGDEIYSAKKLDEATIYPKEQKLIELVKSELSQGRRVWIYCTHTHNRDITERLQKILLSENIPSAVMKQSVNARKREEWIAKQVEAGAKVIISNPRLVETGLDLIDFPTLIFFETEYSTYTLRQSSRRSWRIGQKQEVKVFYFCYEKTIQQKALSLVAKKIKSAMMVDGDVIFEGTVASYKDEGNFFMELARDIIDNSEVRDLNSIFNEVANAGTQGDEFICEHPINTDEQIPFTHSEALPIPIIPAGIIEKSTAFVIEQQSGLYVQQELF